MTLREDLPHRWFRLFLAGALLAVSVAAAYRLCWIRFECDVTKARAEEKLYRETPSDYERLLLARSVMSDLSRCLAYDGADYQALFLMGVAAENAGQADQAVAFYEQALSYNERPETYANIAVVQFRLGDPVSATRNMMRACIFDLNHSLRVAQPMQLEIQHAVAERQKRLLARSASTGPG